MGNRYIVKQNNVNPTAGNDILTIVSASSRRGRLVQVSVNGRGSTSAAQQIEIGRSSSGSSTSNGTVTPGKFDHTDQPAAAFIYNNLLSAQPNLDTNTEVLGWNALGGANRYIPPRGQALEIRNGEQISIRATTGVTFQNLSLTVVTEED
jgi:hypothetical protein